ncbi:sporulation protein SpoOM, partial [Priestia megaterium]
RRARGFGGFLSEMLDADESLVHVHVSEKEIPQLKNILTNIISRYS